jgi:hypothetical protein
LIVGKLLLEYKIGAGNGDQYVSPPC